FEKYDCFSWLLDKKEKGLVKHAGLSFHDTADVLDEILTKHPEMEFVQLQINYLDWESEWIESRKNYEVCVKHGKPVIVMEPVKGGSLAKVPEEAEKLFKTADSERSVSSWAIRFAASLPNVMTVLSGMSTLGQVEDNTAFMENFVPLIEDEQKLCFKVADIINAQTAVPCTGCSYCTEGCPQHIAIPQYFSLYNEIMREDMEKKGWTVSFSNYNALTQNFGKASECIACGQCEEMCPQHLSIIDNLKNVSQRFEQ
ncbi:MAG: aldo/keto reductase, partial [Oscillospiraceae bacterium]|nr:aldo/keto reductase [Oscillospiraceae bacterium]